MRIGVLLGGCGLYDGSDVFETVLVLLALEAAGEKPVLLAPDRMQTRTIDHRTGAVTSEDRRNVLRESARLARGGVRDLREVSPDGLEALIIPGGYGPAVNFGDGFAEPGVERRLDPDVERFLRRCLEDGKPIGLVGLGEIPVRMVLKSEVEVPERPDDPTTLSIDAEHHIVRTPGFSAFTRLGEVRDGVEAMVKRILDLLETRSHAPVHGGRGREPGS